MAAQLTSHAVVDCAPGNVVTLPGSGLTPGAGASVVLQQQGAVASTAVPTGTLAIPGATFNTTSVTFTIPDGAMSGPVLVTAGDGTSDTGSLRIGSQYLQASEYVGEGVDTSTLAAGELDAILRRASGYIDGWLTFPLRKVQAFEQHPWRKSRRVYPYRRNLVSADGFVIRISNVQIATISQADIVINSQAGYVEVLSYAVASYALLGAIQNLGLIANIVELTYTAGYTSLQYPQAIREACAMVATELLDYRFIQAKNLGAFSSVKQANQQYDRRSEPFQMPKPALELIRPYALKTLR